MNRGVKYDSNTTIILIIPHNLLPVNATQSPWMSWAPYFPPQAWGRGRLNTPTPLSRLLLFVEKKKTKKDVLKSRQKWLRNYFVHFSG